MIDDRTPEQHMADVASATLARLAKLQREHHFLRQQLMLLSGWAAEHQAHLDHELLQGIARAISTFDCCVPEAVRDIAATLPIRGLDYGETVQ